MLTYRMNVWEPTLGEILLAKPEPTKLLKCIYLFLRRDDKKEFAKVTGKKMNRKWWRVMAVD